MEEEPRQSYEWIESQVAVAAADYLRAGLPRPAAIHWYDLWHSPVERAAVPEGKLPDLARQPTHSPEPFAYTVLDADGKPVEVAYARMDRYLVKPFRWDFASKGWVVDAKREEPWGIVDLIVEGDGPGLGMDRPVYPDPATAVPVTCDMSVFYAGLRPSKFRPDDALFISMAAAVEMEIHSVTRTSGEQIRSRGAEVWRVSVPVSVDMDVLNRYRYIVFDLIRANNIGPLHRTDLLIAATASVYGAPMYTVHPEYYKGMKHGVKTLKYGPTRNKGACDKYPHEVDREALLALEASMEQAKAAPAADGGTAFEAPPEGPVPWP
jgi:predicted nucleic acid-binding protein